MPTAATGRILAGRYRLISQLGAGGMGITYRAWDDVNAVPVVVKMPKREAQSDEEALSRFAREIDAMLSLPHDHIVPITDHGEENGCPYVVMRFLPGGSLADHRRRDDDGNPLANPVGMLHFWLPAVAEALDFIHEKGVLHRDIKPGNIFFDGFWNAFLGDFGIAKVVDASAGLTKEQTLTATMIAIGTPEYMAPELFSPKGKPDGRADQYALAVTVYEMLSGVKPFTGAKAHIVVEHSGMPVPPLQNKGLGIPMPLCVAVERALAKTPPERFTTCAEFARAALRGVPPLPSEPNTARLMCPSCAKILRMPTSADGQWGKCPKCKVAMRVAPGLSALWLRNEEFGSSDADGEEAAEGDFKESSEKPAGLFSTVPAVASWVSRKARELSQELMAIPPWASLALFIAAAALFLADRGPSMSEPTKPVRSSDSISTPIDVIANAWRERAKAAEAEVRSLRERNTQLQNEVDAINAEARRLKQGADTGPKGGEWPPTQPKRGEGASTNRSEGSFKTNVDSVGIELVQIPAGKFQMGEGGGSVAATLTRPFCLARTEITQKQWQQVMGTTPWDKSVGTSGEDVPAWNISWQGAMDFCQKLTGRERSSGRIPAGEEYRLPTEAEWEYACRAGTTTAYSFGDDESKLGDFAWFSGNAEEKVHAVGTKQPNPWGLCDMHGNVWEWCSDWSSDWYSGKLAGGVDPVGPATGSERVLRGGSFWRDPVVCRSAYRDGYEPSHRNNQLGFRVARGMPVQPAALTAATEAPKNRKTPAPEIMQPNLPLRSVVNSVGITMLELPAGKFLMGERAGSVEVILPGSLWMGKTEVTRGQWERGMGTRPWGVLGSKADDDLPTTDVNWTDVTEFCRKLTDQERSRSQLQDNEVYRLPTEVEWEYACRAGTATAYAFGEDESRLGDFAWFDGNANTKPHPVGKKKPNAWGLYDMSGNVLEWCSGRRGMGACVGRGGSCLLNSDYCKSACRLSLADSVRGGAVGFRVARFTSWQKTAAEPAENAARGSETNKPKLPLKKAVNTIGTEMLEIPAGTFQMGEGANSVAVTLPRPFWMGKTEVTQGQWKHVMGTSPWTRTNVTVADLHPAVNVKWEDVITFCETLTKHERQQRKLLPDTAYRLPTEAEWEYACRAGTTTQFSFGDDALRLGDFACFQNSSWSALVGTNSAGIVGARKPNPWGLHDMHGNVWEWCSDWYSEKLVGGVDPTGPVGRAERVYRGGGWWDPPMNCRSAYRNRRNPKDGYDYLGFRLACGPTTPDSDQTVAGTPPTQATAASQKSTVTLPLESAVNGVGMEMLEIPATEYVMGEVPNSVIVKLTQPFWIGKTEVTQGQWKELMGTEPWKGKGDGPTGTNYPATHTSWSDAVKFCDKLTQLAHDQGRLRAVVYRLPTEAEWECACRAGTVTAYSFGDNNAELAEHAWFMVNAADGSHEVGAKPPNPWGLHDMHGNVREWCADWFGNDLKGGADPAGTAEGTLRVIRGGGWGLGTSQCRSSYRSANGTPATRAGNLGFRVACGSPVVTATRQQAAAAPPITWYLADLSPVDSTVGAYQLEKGALATWRVNDRDVKKGFLACAPSFIDFRVPSPKPSILRGAVGISRVNVNSRVRFAIFGNGKKLWESGVITQKPGDGTSIVEEFAVDLTRVSLLRLAVDPMGEINSDHSVWIDPVVELKTAPTTGSPKE